MNATRRMISIVHCAIRTLIAKCLLVRCKQLTLSPPRSRCDSDCVVTKLMNLPVFVSLRPGG